MRTSVLKSLLVFTVMIAVSTTQAKDKSQKDFELLEKKVKENLATFDDLDFNVFSNQKWDELKRSHTQNVKVHWPDGHITEGIDKHIADLKYMFTLTSREFLYHFLSS